MCQKGGPRCDGEARRRLERARANLLQVQSALENDPNNTELSALLEKAQYRMNAAQECWLHTKGYERELRAEQRRIKEKLEKEELTENQQRLWQHKLDRVVEQADSAKIQRLNQYWKNSQNKATFDSTNGRFSYDLDTVDQGVSAHFAKKIGFDYGPGQNGGQVAINKAGINEFGSTQAEWAQSAKEQFDHYQELQSQAKKAEDAGDKKEAKRLRAQAGQYLSTYHRIVAVSSKIRSIEEGTHQFRHSKNLSAPEAVDAAMSATSPSEAKESTRTYVGAFGTEATQTHVNPKKGFVPQDKNNPWHHTEDTEDLNTYSYRSIGYANGSLIEGDVIVSAAERQVNGKKQYVVTTRVRGVGYSVGSNNDKRQFSEGELEEIHHGNANRFRFDRGEKSEVFTNKKKARAYMARMKNSLSAKGLGKDASGEVCARTAPARVLQAYHNSVEGRLAKGKPITPNAPAHVVKKYLA